MFDMRTLLLAPVLALLLGGAPVAAQTDAELATWADGLSKKALSIVYANRLASAGWKSTDHLVRVLREGDDESRKRALWVLLRTEDDAAAPAVLDLIEAGVELSLACRVISRLESPRAIPLLIRRLKADPEGAGPVVSALGVLGGERAMAAVREAMAPGPVRFQAALAVLVRDPSDGEARAIVVDQARHGDAAGRAAALWVMGQSGEAAYLPEVEGALIGPAPVRLAAIEALGRIADPRSLEVLRQLAGRSTEVTEGKAIASALSRQTGEAGYRAIFVAYIDRVLASEPNSEEDYLERGRTIAEIAGLPADEAAVRLEALLTADPPLPGDALAALRVLESRPDLVEGFHATLATLLADEDLHVKAYAWMLAERSTGRILEWPTEFEQTTFAGSSVQLALGLAYRPRTRKTGCMFLPGLSPGVGVLFVYPAPDRKRFWMKYTFFALDVAFLDDEGRIFHVESVAPAPPGTADVDLPSASADRPARYVLEVRRGFLAENGLGVGSQLTLTERIRSLRAE